MHAHRFDGCNVEMKSPPSMQDDCLDLWTQVDAWNGFPRTISAWKPTPNELLKLNMGESVYLTVIAAPTPPVLLTVGHPDEV